jgi:hypothetical protein
LKFSIQGPNKNYFFITVDKIKLIFYIGIGNHYQQGGSFMRKKPWLKKSLFIALFLSVIFLGWFLIAGSEKDEEKSCFYNSLHHTGEGMRFWYEENGGFKNVTGIPYKELDCQNCHVRSCEQCHAIKSGEKCSYSLTKARDLNTCLSCHSRAKVTFDLCKNKKNLDVHIASGMGCVDCHKGNDVHGDGTIHKTMRDPGAVNVACLDCHEKKEQVKAHAVHGDKLDCAACHIANTTSCLNCHFDRFLEQGTRKGNFFPPCQDWIILVNYKGKVTSGNVQTLIHNGKKFITYAPYFTHAVQAKARECRDCHGNFAVRQIQKGNSIPMAIFKEHRMISWNGIVPLVPEKLKWDFAEKEGDQWMLLKNKEKPIIQFSCYAEPFTEDQIKKMATVYKDSNQ